jgi:pimeloyl-ACP methyl ester carboxylesterase
VHTGKCYFKSLHVDEIDDQARSDYFFQTFLAGSELEKHPLAGYYCNQDVTGVTFNYWRFSALTSYEIMMKGMQSDYSGMNFGEGVEKFTNKVLFLAGECNIMIGPEFQQEQLKLFNEAELVIIKDTGHFMFGEKQAESIAAVRSYFNK